MLENILLMFAQATDPGGRLAYHNFDHYCDYLRERTSLSELSPFLCQ